MLGDLPFLLISVLLLKLLIWERDRISQEFYLAASEDMDLVQIPAEFRALIGERVVRQYFEVRSLWDWFRGRRVGIMVIGKACALVVQEKTDIRWWPFAYMRLDWMEKMLRRGWKELHLTWTDEVTHAEMEVPRWAIKRLRYVFRLARKHWKPEGVSHQAGSYR